MEARENGGGGGGDTVGDMRGKRGGGNYKLQQLSLF